ncbi:ThuA domain-containing protein [Pelagicoccus sp. SDUM812003]|uniref:ThuA domain-containing protein n=1 Tax=Pelagicoccus sp. SDUM812003 TaxID=3041267 RepID=UPI00280CCD21|nr:ThuA domain-containing protein [Pelagicoccus sp. SDUM812003]MDQ8205310.1 ThuA domain-containing protein [Pelagicoccus sp. SDUM812003]
MSERLRVIVWNEFRHERDEESIREVYPQGIHAAIASGLQEMDPDLEVSVATLDEPEHGLSEERLERCDVLFWWGHMAHGEVADAVVDRVQKRVLEGMGLVALHSAHYAKIFKRLLGTTCSLTWREADERERLWVCNPGHPIARGIDRCIELEREEMYGEPFGIPAPDEQVFISWFEGGEVFRSGNCYYRGNGRIFYFRPGHEAYPTYFDPQIKRALANAARWAAPAGGRWVDECPNVTEPREPIGKSR